MTPDLADDLRFLGLTLILSGAAGPLLIGLAICLYEWRRS